EPLVSLDDDNLSVTIRSDGATKFIFINNYDEIDRTSTISYNGKHLFDGQKLTIPARTGVMLPVNCKLNDDIHIVYSTTEIYDVQEDGMSMNLFLKMMTGEEATVVLRTKTYVPVNNDSVQVTLYDDTYFIKVTHKIGESVTLEFQKKL
ncbi:MAG: beta-galactosidase, partial [Fervidobacterium sp.]